MRRLFTWLAALVITTLPGAVSAQDKFFDSNGVQIRYLDRGSGEPIVLIHGYASNIEREWGETGVLSNLAGDHRVIALDSRGHGKSGKPTDASAYGEQMGQDVVRLLDHLKIPRAHIVGYSLGAIINAKLLTTNPERYLTATLGGASGLRTWNEQMAKATEDEAIELTQGIPFRALLLLLTPADQPKPSEEAIRKRSQELLAGNDPSALAAVVRGRPAQVVSDKQMTAVQVPTLGIIGSADPGLPSMKQLQIAWPALRVVVVDGASHGGERGTVRRPEFVNAIREFIASHKATSLK